MKVIKDPLYHFFYFFFPLSQGFKQTFKFQIVRLYYEKLSSAKYKVHAQLLKLAVRDHSSVIGVTRPYLQEFIDNLPSGNQFSLEI